MSITGTPSAPRIDETMWLVAGSIRSWLAEEKISRSMSLVFSPARSSAFLPAAAAKSEAFCSSKRRYTVSTPVSFEMYSTGTLCGWDASAIATSTSLILVLFGPSSTAVETILDFGKVFPFLCEHSKLYSLTERLTPSKMSPLTSTPWRLSLVAHMLKNVLGGKMSEKNKPVYDGLQETGPGTKFAVTASGCVLVFAAVSLILVVMMILMLVSAASH